MVWVAMLLFGCAVEETAAIEVAPEDGADRIYYVYPGTPSAVVLGSAWSVECADAQSLVVQVGDRLCSVVGDGVVLDEDLDGLCDLDPPVTLAVSVWL